MRQLVIGLVGALALGFIPGSAKALDAAAATPTATVPFVSQQPANEWRARLFIDQPVHNTADETVGEVNDLVFDPQGHINTVVLGVGGFLEVGEKNVGVPYSSLTFKVGSKGERVIVVALSKEDLLKAPNFNVNEKTGYEKVKDKAADLGQRAVDKAVELKDRAVKKIDDMKKSEPEKK